MQIIELTDLSSSDPLLKNSLALLLKRCVDLGASIGFVTPFSELESNHYWDSVDNELNQGGRILLLATENQQVMGTVQLSLCNKKNGQHRAEVEKLMVHPDARELGIAGKLMHQVEALAKSRGRTLLILDTLTDSLAANLYLKLGFLRVGEIPNFALSAEGELEATCVFYKQLV